MGLLLVTRSTCTTLLENNRPLIRRGVRHHRTNHLTFQPSIAVVMRHLVGRLAMAVLGRSRTVIRRKPRKSAKALLSSILGLQNRRLRRVWQAVLSLRRELVNCCQIAVIGIVAALSRMWAVMPVVVSFQTRIFLLEVGRSGCLIYSHQLRSHHIVAAWLRGSSQGAEKPCNPLLKQASVCSSCSVWRP